MGRKLLVLILCCAVLAGCGRQEPEKEESEKISVVTTIFPYYDFARRIAGDRAEVELILPAGKDTHSFEPTPKDIIKMERADVLLYNGGSVDSWVEDVLDTLEGERLTGRAMDWADAVEEEQVEGMQEEKGEHHHEAEYDEHIWTSPRNAVRIAGQITELFCQADPDGQEDYRNRWDDYRAELEQLDEEFRAIAESGSRRLIVFGDRFPFRYLAEEYSLEYRAAFPGCSTETEPAMGTIAYLIDLVKEEQIPVVYYVELSSHKVADAIAETAGARTLLLHSCHNVTREEFDSGVTYLELMKQNAVHLKEGLTAKDALEGR